MKNIKILKFISIIVSVFLITTSISDFAYAISATPTMQQSLANTDVLKNFNFNTNIISYDLGKITSAINCNSDTVVVNIQDFHCNPSVQKNISDIIASLVKKYNIKSVYVEGGYGNINTKWLSEIKDENIRKQLTEILLENGSLTGAEYFSATNPSAQVNIYGIEKENVYKENFERLQNIFSNKNKYEQIIKVFEKDLIFLQNKYFNVGNKKFNDLLKKHRNGQIETRKYYKFLFRYVQKYKNSTNDIYGTLLPIKIEDYPNIYTYMALGEYEKNIKFAKITVELKQILAALKTTLSYEQYSQIITNTNNLKDISELVSVLNALPEDFKNSNFSSEMKTFINYIEISKKINPINLVEEERKLVENLRLALSKNEDELAISFLSDFFNYFSDYLNTSITADNYKYFSSHFGKFQTLWDKYTYYNQINKYKKELDILDAYYKTNVQRDYLFLENIEQTDILKPGTNGKQDYKYANILEKAKNIVIIVTGGFHTQGLKTVMTKNNISYMVITPNVKGGVDFANSRYEQLLQIPQIDTAKQAFQLPLLSNGERLNIVYEGLKQLDVQPTQENIEILNTTANEIVSNLTGRHTKYTNTFETDEGTIHVNKHKFFDMQNLLKLTIKEHINSINPKNYSDETFSFMKNFAPNSNGMIYEISTLDNFVIEQLRDIGYSEYLPEFLQHAYYNIGKKILKNNAFDNNENMQEYEFSSENCPFIIKFPSGKIIEILRQMDTVINGFQSEKYYIIDEDFSWDMPAIFKDKKDLVKYLEKQDYAKDKNGNCVIQLKEEKDSRNRSKMFIVATEDVEFIDLTEININIPLYDNNYSYAQVQMDKDLISVLNETNNKYSQNSNMINASEIENVNKLDTDQVVFICLQDFIDAQSKKKKRIEEYIEYAVKNNKPVIIYPNIYAAHAELSNADLRFLFAIMGDRFVDFADFYVSTLIPYIIDSLDFDNINEYHKNAFRKFLSELLKYSLKEILKNTFVHGNLSELNKPIVINFDKNNPQIDILNLNQKKEENIYRKLLTFVTDLRGFGRGISEIKEGFNKIYNKYPDIIKDDSWQYLDNFEDENRTVSRASLKLNNKDSYLKIDKTKLKDNDYYNEISDKILEIFKKHNIDINLEENSRAFNYIVSILLNTENIISKDLEKLNGTKTEIAELILDAFDKKAVSLDKTSKHYANMLIRMEDITVVLKLKGAKEIDFVSLQVSGFDGNPKLFVTAKNDDRYGEGSNSSTLEFNEYFQSYKNYEVLNIHIIDDKNTRGKPFDNLLDTGSNKEELKKNIDKETIKAMGYDYDDVEIISLNDFGKNKNLKEPNQATQKAKKDLESGKVVALFPPLHNLDLQKINSFEELKYMYDVIRTVLWDFSEDFKKATDNTELGNIDVILNEILKNAFVHGNNLKTDQPIYLYIKDGRFYVSNVVDEKSIANQKQKFAATMAGLCGVHKGIDNIKRYRGIEYKDEQNNSIFTASFKTNLKLNNKNENSDDNIIYRGKSDNPFIVKLSDTYMFLVEPVTVAHKQKGYVIPVENNIIRGDENALLPFLPWAYGLEIKEENEEVVIRKALDLPDDIRIIPISELSPINFAISTLDELSRKIFKEDTNLKKTDIDNDKYETVFLEDLMRGNPDKIMAMWDSIDENIKNGKPIKIYPLRNYNNKKVIAEMSENDYDNFVQLYRNLNIVITNFGNNYRDRIFENEKFNNLDDKKKKTLEKEFRYGLVEMIKNAIIHGNHLDLSKPITLEFDKETFEIKISNEYTQVSKEEYDKTLQLLKEFRTVKTEKDKDSIQKDAYIVSQLLKEYPKLSKENALIILKQFFTLKHLVACGGLAGFRLGIEKMSDKDKNFNYSDNFSDENRTKSIASFKLNNDEINDNIIYKGAYNDFFVVDAPGKEPVFVRFHRGSFNTTNYIIEAKGSKVNKNEEKLNFAQYGLKLQTSSDGKEITIIKDKNYKKGTNVIGIPVRYDSSQNKENKLSPKEIKEHNENNKNFFDDLGINISNDKEYEIIHLQDLSSDLDYKIRTAISNNKPLIIYPYLYEDFKVAIQNKDYAKLYFLFKELGGSNHLLDFTNTFADIVTNNRYDEFNLNLKTSVKEVLKNSIIHGNNMDLSLPVVIKFDKESSQIDIFNQNINTKQDKILKNIVVAADWTGFGEGIKKMQSFDTLEYSDNNNGSKRAPNDKIWQTTLKKKKDIVKEIKNKMVSKIDVNDEIAQYLIEHIITIPNDDLLNVLGKSKSEILKMLFDELEKAAFNLQRLPSIMTVLKNTKVIVEKNDGTTICLTLVGNRLAIYAQNGDYVNYKYLDGQTENDLIENVKDIHIAYIDDEGYDHYKESLGNKLKNYDAATLDYPSDKTINKMGFVAKDLVSLKLNEFINDTDTFKEKLFTNLQNGKLVTIFPYSAHEISAENTIFKEKYINNEFLKEIAFYLADKTRENSDEYFSSDYGYDILEMLKNTFVHGNNLSFDKPIFMYVKDGRFYVTNIVDKENTASNYQKTLAVLSNLTGVHEGNNFIGSHVELEYKYPDITKLQTGDIYETSIKIGNIDNNIVYTGNYEKIEDTIFMIELPDTDKYNSKYTYIHPRKGKLLIRAVDNKDNLAAGNYTEICLEDLNKEDLKNYGILDFQYDGKQFKITHKQNVKIIKLSQTRNIKLQFDEKIQKKLIKNSNEKNKEFLENKDIGIDISKENIDISNEKLNKIKNIGQKNVVLNLQDFNRNDKEQLYKIEKNIEYCLQKDIPIIIYPCLNENIQDLDYSALKLLFKVTGIKLLTFCNFYSEIVSRNWNADYNDFKFSFFETLKNAIIHGNNADLSLPIVIKSNKKESKIEIINNNIPNREATNDKEINLLGKFFATVEEWHGQGLGIKSMLNKDTLTYSDNNIVGTTNKDLWTASITLKNKNTNQQESIDNNVEDTENEGFTEEEYENFFSSMVKTVANNVIKNNCNTYLEKDIDKLPFDKENISVFGFDSFYIDDKEFADDIFETLQAGNTIALYPQFLFLKMKTNYGENYGNIPAKNLKFLYEKNNEMFNKFSIELAEHIKNTYNPNINKKELSTALYKILKNAFVHGNNLSFNKPAYIYIKDGKLYITNIVDNEHSASSKELTAAAEAGLRGNNDIISKLKSIKYNYPNINELGTGDLYETSIKINNASEIVKDNNVSNVYELIKDIPSSLVNMCVSMFGISAATHYYINYEFINNIKDAINANKDERNRQTLNVKIINKNIDKDIDTNNLKMTNSGLKVNGEIVWINKNNNDLLVYCKEQSYEEILSVAKNIAAKTVKANKTTDLCIDTRAKAPTITEINGITAINSSVYNELKDNNLSDTQIASAIKDANIMEQKTNMLYSVSKGNQIFLEYEIKDDVSYNNFVNNVLAENLGFGYVIDVETVNKYGKDFEMILEQAKEEKNINIYIKGKDNQINFRRIENFNDIETLEEEIEKVNFSEDVPLIPASKLLSLVEEERFTDKFTILNKLTKLLFAKREYNEGYVQELANNADEKLLKEISNYDIEKILNDLKESKFDNISDIISQNPVVKITFKKIEQNVSDTVKAEQLKTEFVKTIAVRTILYNLSNNKMLSNKYRKNLKDIEELFTLAIKDENQFNRINIKDNKLSFDNEAIEIIEEIKQKYGSDYLGIISLKEYNAITKLEYILNYLVDERRELNNDNSELNSMADIKAILSAA